MIQETFGFFKLYKRKLSLEVLFVISKNVSKIILKDMSNAFLPKYISNYVENSVKTSIKSYVETSAKIDYFLNIFWTHYVIQILSLCCQESVKKVSKQHPFLVGGSGNNALCF